MAMREAAPLLSLLGHELRAPTGVIGGYLALIERAGERLGPEQQQALAGARRAQQCLVEILDEASRLVATWKADDGEATVLDLAAVLGDVRTAAATGGLPLTSGASESMTVRVTALRAAVADAIVTVAAAVAREHGVDARLTVSRLAPGAVTCHIRAAGGERDAAAPGTTREPFQQLRSGLGLRVVVAAAVLTGAGAHLDEVLEHGKRIGVDITFAATD